MVSGDVALGSAAKEIDIPEDRERVNGDVESQSAESRTVDEANGLVV